MVLEISGEKKGPSYKSGSESDAEKSSLLQSILGYVWSSPHLPFITSATIDRNSIDLSLNLEKSDGRIKQVFEDFFLIDYKDESIGKTRKTQLRISLDPERNYNFVFQTNKGFHKVVDDIFATKSNYKSLEQVGLDTPSLLDVSLHYQTPLGVWHGLPSEFLEKIIGFEFSSANHPFPLSDPFTIGWPKLESEHYLSGGKPVKNELQVRVSKERLEEIKKQLIQTGFVEYQIKQSKERQEHQFLVNPDGMNYKSLQILENIVRQEIHESRNSDGPYAQIIIKGEFSRDIFSKVPSIFDSYNFQNLVSAGNIVVSKYSSKSDDPVSVTLQQASFEDAARLISKKSLYKYNMLLQPMKDEYRRGDPIEVIKEVKEY